MSGSINFLVEKKNSERWEWVQNISYSEGDKHYFYYINNHPNRYGLPQDLSDELREEITKNILPELLMYGCGDGGLTYQTKEEIKEELDILLEYTNLPNQLRQFYLEVLNLSDEVRIIYYSQC